MTQDISSPRGLATLVGVLILAASVNMNIMATGGYFTSHALLVASLSLGVLAGARVIGVGVAGRIAIAIILALVCGELYNLSATAERIVVERESTATPLKDALAKHTTALDKLRDAETAKPGSIRLVLAKDAQAKAQAAYEKELREGGRCLTICKGLLAKADAAQIEVTAAATEAQALHAAAVEAAKADVDGNPVPASATALADRLGWAPWALDLVIASLLSIGANGLASVLIAYGAHSVGKDSLPAAANDEEETDFTVSDFELAKVRALVAGNVPKGPLPPKPRKRAGRKADPKVVDFTEKFRERHGRGPTGRDIKQAFPSLPVSTAYDYAARARVAV